MCVRTHTANLSLANLKDLVLFVDDWSFRSACTCEGDSPVVGSQFNGSLAGDRITGVETHSTRNSTETGKVLQGHLRGTILTYKQAKKSQPESTKYFSLKVTR